MIGGVGAETGVDARMVEAAAAALTGVVTRTALEPSPRLSERFGVEVFVKREDLQVVRSYKVRGAYTVIDRLDPQAREAALAEIQAAEWAGMAAWVPRMEVSPH